MTKSFFREFMYLPPHFSGLPVIYRDEDVLVLNKPAGLLSVCGKTPDLADCLESRVLSEFPHATVVHRLDMSTSGIIVMALNPAAHRNLSRQFELRKTEKVYIAEIWGKPRYLSGFINLPLRCDWVNRPRQMVDFINGREAKTGWEVLSIKEGRSRVKLIPVTGRSHQLRVHMKILGNPILGDEFYAHDAAYQAADRLMLHAQTLGFYHPVTREYKVFEAVCPF